MSDDDLYGSQSPWESSLDDLEGDDYLTVDVDDLHDRHGKDNFIYDDESYTSEHRIETYDEYDSGITLESLLYDSRFYKVLDDGGDLYLYDTRLRWVDLTPNRVRLFSFNDKKWYGIAKLDNFNFIPFSEELFWNVIDEYEDYLSALTGGYCDEDGHKYSIAAPEDISIAYLLFSWDYLKIFIDDYESVYKIYSTSYAGEWNVCFDMHKSELEIHIEGSINSQLLQSILGWLNYHWRYVKELTYDDGLFDCYLPDIVFNYRENRFSDIINPFDYFFLQTIDPGDAMYRDKSLEYLVELEKKREETRQNWHE